VDSGLTVLSVKGLLSGKSFNYLRKWLVLRGAVSPGSARLQMSKHQNKKTHLIQMKRPLPDVWNRESMMVTVFPRTYLFCAWPHAVCFACVNSEPSEPVIF